MKTTEICPVRVSCVWLGKLLGGVIFALLISFSALVKIPLPFTPVPVTLQNLVVFLAGALLGPAIGPASVALYIGIGIFGAPLFANTGAGFLYLLGPTGGYLIGFLVAAWHIGHLLRQLESKNIFVVYLIMLSGAGIIYCLGGIWLGIAFGWNLERILFLGVAPFLIPDIIKAFIAAVIYKHFQYFRGAR